MMILNPAGPSSFFLPVGVEVGQDGPPATGVYVGQPGLLWREVGIRLPRVRRWHWTRALNRPGNQS